MTTTTEAPAPSGSGVREAMEEARFALFCSDMRIKDRADQALRLALASLASEAGPRGEAVAWVQKEALAELAKHKDATATISSGLLKKPFGNPVALYAHPAPAPAPAEVVEAGPFGAVMAEVRRVTAKFPTWPTDPLHALAVLGEEFGELTKETLQLTYEPHKSTVEDFRKEAHQTAAMALRFLASLDAYQFTPAAQHQQNALASPAHASETEGLRS